MALICDTGGVYALYDADDLHHNATKAVVEAEPGPLFLPLVEKPQQCRKCQRRSLRAE